MSVAPTCGGDVTTRVPPSRLAFGCCPLGGHGWGRVNVEEVQRAIRIAVASGITIFDTADVYGFGLSERRLADALGQDRRRLHIVTKVGLRWDGRGRTARDGSPRYLRRAVAASLRRLRVDAIPTVLLHWPDPDVPIEESLGTLAELQEEGQLLTFGASNAENVGTYIPWSQHHVSLLTGRLAPASRGAVCAMAWGTLEQGLLTGHLRTREGLDPDDRRQRLPMWSPKCGHALGALLHELTCLARETGWTPGTLAIHWALERGGVDVAVVGIKSSAQLASALRSSAQPVTSSHLDVLDHAASNARSSLGSVGQ